METPKSTGGRPAHHRTAMHRRLVQVLAAQGVPQREICRVLEIDEKTLRKHFRHELDVGASKLEAALIMHLHRIACGRDGTALRAVKFILKARFGWSEYAPPPRG
jgi:DNA-binding CsgD family transcriptional regulator